MKLLAFQVRITPSSNNIFGAWREGADDDLVLAAVLACWLAEWGYKQYGRDYGVL